MRTRVKIGGAILVLTLFLVAIISFGTRHVHAAGEQPPGPDRYAVILQKYTSFIWWLTSWVDNEVVCSIDIDHEGLPTGGEILEACGQDLYNGWIQTDACTPGDRCSGFYLQLIKTGGAKRKVGIKQPPPVIWVTLDGCVPYKSTFRCDSLPTLILTAVEPITGEKITSIAGTADGESFTCDPICQLNLGPTGENGMNLEFWAFSSYGDSSDVFTARVRVARSGDSADPAWYTDILSTQWRGDTLAGCSSVWDSFPPVGGLSAWLTTPQRPEELATNVPYEFLAANLIKHGMADVSICNDGGLTENGQASVCGVEAARPAVIDWQNRFDGLIFSTALKTGIPATLLKNIFARESQFWPGTTEDHPEVGFGQMTEGGADVILTWNPSFYEQFCPGFLDGSECKNKIYPQPEAGWQGMGLNDDERALLRGALIKSVDATCPDCSMGIDLQKADYSVEVFAQALLGTCGQAAKVIDMNYRSAAGIASSFEDLWRFTLVDYNAGPGCLGLAVDKTNRLGEPLDWNHLSSHLTPACQGAIEYVNNISHTEP